jgi:hypothetical protein
MCETTPWCHLLHLPAAPPSPIAELLQSTSEFFVITMVAYPCRCVMGSQVSSMTWLYGTASFSFPWVKFLFVVALFLSAAQWSCQIRRVWILELFFLPRTASDSGAARLFCLALPPSPFTFGGSCLETTPKKIEIEQFFILLSTWPGESLGELENLGESWWKPW